MDRALFVDQAACDCGTWHRVRRFIPTGETLGPCTHCGGSPQPSPFHSQSELPADAAFASVSIPDGHAVVVRGPQGQITLLTTRRQL